MGLDNCPTLNCRLSYSLKERIQNCPKPNEPFIPLIQRQLQCHPSRFDFLLLVCPPRAKTQRSRASPSALRVRLTPASRTHHGLLRPASRPTASQPAASHPAASWPSPPHIRHRDLGRSTYGDASGRKILQLTGRMLEWVEGTAAAIGGRCDWGVQLGTRWPRGAVRSAPADRAALDVAPPHQ